MSTMCVIHYACKAWSSAGGDQTAPNSCLFFCTRWRRQNGWQDRNGRNRPNPRQELHTTLRLRLGRQHGPSLRHSRRPAALCGAMQV